MRIRTLLPLAAAAALAAPGTASANFLHVVTPGESLASVAATDGLSVAQLAAANGISPATGLLSGATLAIPPRGAGVSAPAVTTGTVSTATGARAGDGDGDSDDPGGTVSAAAPTSAPAAGSASVSGSYVVRPGDTLSAIAARAGMTVAQLAAQNGLNPSGYLVSGTALRLGGGGAAGPTSAAVSQPVGVTAQGSGYGPPYTTPQRVTASQVGSIAAANGVPPSLADAIGWQESGFNNALTASDGGRGVMQIMPGTWQWINSSLTRTPLSPYSAADNVRGGVLLLHSLLQATGGNQSLAAAGYNQGLPSVERHGLFPSTQRYVRSVMSLASSFGGG